MCVPSAILFFCFTLLFRFNKGKWDLYLTKISDSQEKCNLCNHRLGGQKKASTAEYIYHFKSKHPMEYEKIMGKSKPTDDEPLEDIDEASPSSKKPRLIQLSIVQSFSMWSEEGQKTRDIERAIMQLICADALPLQTVERAGSRNLLKVILPQWKHLKSRAFFTRNKLPRLFEEYENRSELEEVDWLAVSFDIYADEGNFHQVVGVVAHFIKYSAEVYRVLGLIDAKNDSHRGVVIKNKVEDLFESFEILSKMRKID